MGKVTLQFSTEHDPASEAIRLYSHSAFSHVDGVLPDGSLLGSRSDGGVQIRAPRYAPFSSVLQVSVETEIADDVYQLARTQIGKPYDWKAIAAFAFDRQWDDPDSWFCSEFWTWVLVGKCLLRPIPITANRVTPGDLLLLLSQVASY